MAVGIFIVTQLLFLVIPGWQEMKRMWKESVGLGIVVVIFAWVALYGLSIVITIYDGQQGLVAKNITLSKGNETLAAENTRL